MLKTHVWPITKLAVVFILPAALAFSTLAGCASIEPLIVMSHTSNPKASRRDEITSDFLGAGATITSRDGKVETDLAIGRRAVNCGLIHGEVCDSELGGLLQISWRPMRRAGR